MSYFDSCIPVACGNSLFFEIEKFIYLYLSFTCQSNKVTAMMTSSTASLIDMISTSQLQHQSPVAKVPFLPGYLLHITAKEP